jgi:hypothetical protein
MTMAFELTCKFYTGVLNEPACAASVRYRDVRQTDEKRHGGFCYPCMNHPELACEKRELPTPREIK